ncbi:SMI1/KNR4 family protein [Streptacidiphilus albus]|uniref:SMI1/KNR4 family protein n=1 Tax=Streptacidiphilus albus TaxID=105425 RepID=UPI001364903E|nr:SMI1/KNR4 family protein [Streptacidiphilus albus]
MSADLDDLARFLPPPEGGVSSPPWEGAAAEIGIDFPGDYREFVGRYGGGVIYTALDEPRFFVYAPSLSNGGFNRFVDRTHSDFRPLFEFDGADEDYWGGVVYPIHPASGGLLAWGENEDGDIFFWLTGDPDPDRWPVIMWARGAATTYRFEGGMVAFLLNVLHGDHPASEWLTGPRMWWIMESDWLREGLSVSSGPPAV